MSKNDPSSLILMDSQVAPLVLYHGSTEKRETFLAAKGNRYTLGQTYQVDAAAFFFTPDLAFAQTFGPAVTSVEVRASKFLDLREGAWGQDDLEVLKILENHFGERVGFYPPDELWAILDDKPSADGIQALGYEAVWFLERDAKGDPHDTCAVFDASRLKVVGSVQIDRGLQALAAVEGIKRLFLKP